MNRTPVLTAAFACAAFASLAASCRESSPPTPSPSAPARTEPATARPSRVPMDAGTGVARPPLPRLLPRVDSGYTDAEAPPPPPSSGRPVDVSRVPPGRGWYCYRFASHTQEGSGDPCRRTQAECQASREHEHERGSMAGPCEERAVAYCTTFVGANGQPTAFCRLTERGCNAGARAILYEINRDAHEELNREISDCGPVP